MTKKTPKKLKKSHRLCGYFDQLEVYELKLYIKKNPQIKSMSDFIRKALFTYKKEDNAMLEKILSEIKQIKLSGRVVDTEKQEKRKKEAFEEDVSKVSTLEQHRREVIGEMKEVFAQDKKGNLCKPPKEEMKEIELARQKRLEAISQNVKNKK